MNKYILTFLLLSFGCFTVFSQVIDTAAGSVQTQEMKNYIVPVVFIGYGLVALTGDNLIRKLDYSTNAELREDHPKFAAKIDNYLRHVPAAAVYGLDLAGVRAKNNLVDRSIMLATSYVLVSLTATSVKGLADRIRPNGGNHSFPSSHTSTAFMTAEFLHQEYKDHSIWYSVGGYAIATATGIFRLYNNAHWVSDIVAGAGFGILSTRITYLVYPYIKQKLFRNKSPNLFVSPGYQNGYISFNLTKRFN